MIGVFDSGLGGLSVLAAIAEQCPTAPLIYLADSAHVPYGPRPEAFIRERVLTLGALLVERGCSTVVVACNTATAAAIAELRAAQPGTHIVGIEPGIKPAARACRSGHIAVLATEATARSARLAQLIRAHAPGLRVSIVPCPDWATRIETLQHHDPQFLDDIRARIAPLLADHVDHLVLGCTHYSFLIPQLDALIDASPPLAIPVKVLDVAAAVARRVAEVHAPPPLPSQPPAGSIARLHLLATAHPERLAAALPRLGLTRLNQRLGGQSAELA